MAHDPFNARATLSTPLGNFTFFRLNALEAAGLVRLERLPFSIRVLLESTLRQIDAHLITEQVVRSIAHWQPTAPQRSDIPFQPARVIMQDFTGVPAVVDLAAMRSALKRIGGDPQQINPQIPVDLVIDHSVQVDFFASPQALQRNTEMEFQRNRERYEFLRWGQETFSNFRVVPPATGIIHQVNLEYLAGVVLTKESDGAAMVFADTLVGTDSHTTMINGLGVLGWGVGGIEAEAAILGQPIVMLIPDVIGFRLHGQLAEGTTATDMVLTITEKLRRAGVVGKFVEFFGSGLSSISLPDRATIANMAPEYGATVGFFPVDDETLSYLRLSGRDPQHVDLVERYTKEQQLFRHGHGSDPDYTQVFDFDLSSVEPCLAGPRRPQDRIPLSKMQSAFRKSLTAPIQAGGFELKRQALGAKAQWKNNGDAHEIRHGAVVLAAITSCTNTSNPMVMMAAGLLAKNALERGLTVKPYVKTSLAPGSGVVTEYLQQAGLLKPLGELGFNVVGYGCTTCIGNSGPLSAEVVKSIQQADLVVSAVLSGNRNFEGRINPHVRANYLASPPLVVAYAIAGTMDIDWKRDPIGLDPDGNPVLLSEIWPSLQDIRKLIQTSLSPDLFKARYANVFTGNEIWNSIPFDESDIYAWDPDSSYIQEPPFFQNLSPEPLPIREIHDARVLVFLGDTVTTDHISPAGPIPVDSAAGKYLMDQGIQPRDFNTFGARRGNDRLLTRGTFGNIRLKNQLVPGAEGGVTLHLPEGEKMSIYDAAMRYKEQQVPLLVLAGKEYGTGSSRDWAAKGTLLLGVRAVLAESYERIHRSNLVGMGVLPLEFLPGEGAQTMNLSGYETFDILDLNDDVRPGATLRVRATRVDGSEQLFQVRARLDTPMEIAYYRNGGILHTVLRQMFP